MTEENSENIDKLSDVIDSITKTWPSTCLTLDEPDWEISTTRPNFTFGLDGKIFLIIDENGIHFNRDAFAEWTPDDFAKAFLDILGKSYDVKFEKLETKENHD